MNINHDNSISGTNSSKLKALHTKKSPIEKHLSGAFGGTFNEKEKRKLMKKGKSYRIKHF